MSAGWHSTYWNTARLSSSWCVHLIAFAVNLTLIVSIIFAKTLTERLKTRWYQRFENLLCRLLYSTSKHVFFRCETPNISCFKGHWLNVSFVFRLKDKAEDSLRHSFLGGHVAIIWTSSHSHAMLLLLGDGFIQTVWLLSGSLHTLSFCMQFTYICLIYIIHLFFKWQGGAAFELE